MKLKIKIINKYGKNNCPRGYKIGDEFIINDGKTPKDMCCSAFASAWPFARTLLLTKNKKNECIIVCPDGILEYGLELIK